MTRKELNQKDIDEFKTLFKECHGIELSDIHARVLAYNLIAGISLVEEE